MTNQVSKALSQDPPWEMPPRLGTCLPRAPRAPEPVAKTRPAPSSLEERRCGEDDDDDGEAVPTVHRQGRDGGIWLHGNVWGERFWGVGRRSHSGDPVVAVQLTGTRR